MTQNDLKQKFLDGELISIEFMNHPLLAYDVFYFYNNMMWCLYITVDKKDSVDKTLTSINSSIDELVDEVSNEKIGSFQVKLLDHLPYNEDCSAITELASKDILSSI